MVLNFIILYYNHLKEVSNMNNENKETITKTMRFEKDLHDQIQKLAEENQRDFTKQVKFMVIEYMKITQKK